MKYNFFIVKQESIPRDEKKYQVRNLCWKRKKKGNGKKTQKRKKSRNNGSSYWVILLCTFMTKEIGANLNNIKKNKKE